MDDPGGKEDMSKKYLLAVIIIFYSNVLYANPELNDRNEASVEETTGFVSGAILGGLAGGPAGVILGASFGALLGDKWTSNKESFEEIQVALQKSNLELTLTRSQLASLNQRYSSVNSELQRTRVSYSDNSTSIGDADASCCEAKISIHFKTGETEIEEHYKEELNMIANQARRIKNSKIEIFGYADRNGDAENNLELSKQRSNSVENFLIQNGIDRTSVTAFAYGDTKPLQSNSNYESDFFDRRVTIHIRTDLVRGFVTNQLVRDAK